MLQVEGFHRNDLIKTVKSWLSRAVLNYKAYFDITDRWLTERADAANGDQARKGRCHFGYLIDVRPSVLHAGRVLLDPLVSPLNATDCEK